MHELNLVDVQKRYREKDAVRGFTFTFTNGVYGLLGENGAGKTTLSLVDLRNFTADKRKYYL